MPGFTLFITLLIHSYINEILVRKNIKEYVTHLELLIVIYTKMRHHMILYHGIKHFGIKNEKYRYL